MIQQYVTHGAAADGRDRAQENRAQRVDAGVERLFGAGHGEKCQPAGIQGLQQLMRNGQVVPEREHDDPRRERGARVTPAAQRARR